MAEVETTERPSLQDTVRAAMQEHSAPVERPEPVEASEPVAEAPQETAQEREARERDEKGRFAAKKPDTERQTLSLKPKAPKEAAAAPVDPAKQVEAKPVEPVKVVPPPSWFKGAGKLDWNKLPDPIRGELNDLVGKLETERQEVAPIKDLIDTNRQFLVNEAGSLPEAFRQLIQFAQMAKTVDGAMQVAHHVLQRHGIDPRAAFASQPQQGQPGQPQQIDSRLIEQIVEQRLRPLTEQAERAKHQQNMQTVEAFASDPAHPYFNDVSGEMEALLKSGIAKDLKDAYDKAIKLNPVISTQLEQQRQKEAEDQRKANAEKARKAAAASVKGSPVPDASRGVGGDRKSVLEAARQAFAEHSGA